jgi:predicted RNA binding protein YcfA (HicA-like mRNA interferase family)
MIHLHNVNAHELITALCKIGYIPTRQTGSHIRLTIQHKSQHHITIPNHDPLRIGTLNAILNEVSGHLEISKRELVKRLF